MRFKSNGKVGQRFGRPSRSRFGGVGAASELVLRMPPHMPDSTRDLARQVLTATYAVPSSEHDNAVSNVTERLGIELARFAGADSFKSLLRRSLVLASVEVPALGVVTIGEDGRLLGLEHISQVGATDQMNASAADEAALAITTHLLALLATFIGLPFTVRLVRDAWPAITLDLNQSRTRTQA